jgi:hypothetical protein
MQKRPFFCHAGIIAYPPSPAEMSIRGENLPLFTEPAPEGIMETLGSLTKERRARKTKVTAAETLRYCV